MVNLLTILVASAAAVLLGRHLRVRWQTGTVADALCLAWRKVWPAAPMTWAQLDQRIWRRLCVSVTPGVSGHIIVPATFLVSVSPADGSLLADARPAMEVHLAAELRKRARSKGWKITSGPIVAIRPDVDVYDGFPQVRHWFSENPSAFAPAASDLGSVRSVGTPPTELDPAPSQEARSNSRWQPDGPVHHLGVDTVPLERFSLTGPAGLEIQLDPRSGSVTVGRSLDCGLVVSDPKVSARHAVLSFRSGAWSISDASSHNGTWIGGQRLTAGDAAPSLLQPGTEISLGRTGPILVFDLAGPGTSAPGGSKLAVGQQVPGGGETQLMSAATG